MTENKVEKTVGITSITLAEAKASAKQGTKKEEDSDLNQSVAAAEHKGEMLRQERAKGLLELKEIEHRHDDQIANREMRQKYAKWVYYYLVGYSVVIGVFILLSATKCIPFEIESDVMNVLVGSTAVSAIGLVYAVTHGLFSPRNTKK